MADVTPVVPDVPVVKPGYQSSEFWLAVAAAVDGFMITSGAFHGTALSVIVFLGTVLGSSVYAVARTSAKNKVVDNA